ncbi:pyranose oxidase [Streptomyces sp. 1222.5]|uniref:pyranose oxidase n=1 Tax=Streptomyces sp. 1222.5 TaxID=1881026 RepID=UPI003EBDADBD
MADITQECDVLIVGSGPIGATFARKLVAAGLRVMMLEAGEQLSARPGENLKNAYIYQRDPNLFDPVIRGHLHLLSVPTSVRPELAVDPYAYPEEGSNRSSARNAENPDQDPYRNIPAAAACYAVGGMATHWTCACPRHHPTMERYQGISPEDWDRYYSEGEELLGVSRHEFDESVRQRLVVEALRKEFADLPEGYEVQGLPLAVQRRKDNARMVRWAGADTVFGDLADQPNDRFTLLPHHLCTRLVPDSTGSRIAHAEARDLAETRVVKIVADRFVVAAGSVLTPQLLWASGIRPHALGRYLTEHPTTFCQVTLLKTLVDRAGTDERFAHRLLTHREAFPDDSLTIPVGDPDPNIWIPVSEGRPWHVQINRDSFSYGDIPPHVDGRLIVDLRWFGMVDSRPENRVTFSDRYSDVHDMPQPTFDFAYSAEDGERLHAMMGEMVRAALAIGGFLPGAEPRFPTPGLPLHLAGTVRMGEDPQTSVVDTHSRVWGFGNLYLGGNGLIPTSTASNPTLTSVAMALKCVDAMIEETAAGDRSAADVRRTSTPA